MRSISVALVACFAFACSSSPNSPDAGATGGSAGGGNAGGGGAGGGSAGGGAASGGGAGGGDADAGTPDGGPSDLDSGVDLPPPCTNGTACDFSGANGICTNMQCAACSGGDAGCQAAYGLSYACLQGSCAVPSGHCATSDDCDVGQTCEGGTCVAAASCSGSSVGSTCGNGIASLCCTRGGTLSCVDVACCTVAQCGANMDCQGGACVPSSSGCVSPIDGFYYVDPAYSGPSTGSSTCPFKTLHGAFHAIRVDDFSGNSQVQLKSGSTINAASEGGASYFPLNVPAATRLFTPIGQAPGIIVAPPNTTAFETTFTAASGSTQLNNLEITQAVPATAGSAVRVISGSLARPVQLDHIEVHNFLNGVIVEALGKLEVDPGVNMHNNAACGLRIAGGRADVLVGATSDRTHFDNNDTGICVTSDAASILNVVAAQNSAGLKTVTMSGNTSNGLRTLSPNPANELHHVGLVNNGGSAISISSGCQLKVRDSNISGSGNDGVHVLQNPNLFTTLAGIDLGTLNDIGRNTFTASTDVHLCISSTGDGTHLAADGNTWGTLDCSVVNPNGTIRYFNTCLGHAGGVGENGAAHPSTPQAQVSNCTLTP